MPPTPSKSLRIALGSIAVSAAAGSISLGAAMAQDGPPRAEPARAAEQTAAKGDAGVSVGRIEELPPRPAASPMPLHIRIAPGISDDLLPRAATKTELREIEAELLNAYSQYKTVMDPWLFSLAREFNPAMREVHEKSMRSDLGPTLKPVRALLGRLREIKDRRQDVEDAIKDRVDLLNELSVETAKLDAEYESLQERIASEPAADRRRSERQLSRLADEINQGRETTAAVKQELIRLRLALKPLERQAAEVDRLIAWAREHFKEGQLTIEDAPSDVK